MELLFVDACPRRRESRTLSLARYMLGKLAEQCPDLVCTTHCLAEMGLKDISARRLKRREALCDRMDWDDPLIRTGRDFRKADAVVIAAPYWDLSFPSVVKTWVENIWVRNLTFVYRQDKPVGLARGKAAVYLTTSGSPIAGHDWGTAYIEDVMHTLGIPGFLSVKAEGLDLDGADVGGIMEKARADAAAAAGWLAAEMMR